MTYLIEHCHPEPKGGISNILKNHTKHPKMKKYWVHIMSNKTRSVLYVGITNNLYRRYQEHRNGIIEGFTKKYKCHDLIYFEEYSLAYQAIDREKEIKAWRREKKDLLIASLNPEKKNLAEEWPPHLTYLS